nr:diacylglycerol kinase family protein [uncultured Agathobaculum sp.]
MGKNIRKLHESFQHALRGLNLCIHGERNFRVHMVTAFYVTVFALMGRADAAEGAILCICFGLTMGAELMNTAIERLCDRQAYGYDGYVRNAKDIAAAGVFVCAVACVAVGVCVFLGGGVLWTALGFLLAHLWVAMALLVTVPAALWFIFHYGRIQ